MKRGLYGAMVGLSILIVLGAAGASDNVAISLIELDTLLAIACVMAPIGCFGLYLEDARERNGRRTRRDYNGLTDESSEEG